MTAVEKTIKAQQAKCEAEAFAYLRKTAEETIYYVALGKCLKRELAEKFGLTENDVGGILLKAAVDLMDKIRCTCHHEQ